MLAVLHIHGAGLVGDLIGLVLLMGLQSDELGPLPVLALKEGVQIPGLVGAIGKQDGLRVLGAHLAAEVYRLEENRRFTRAVEFTSLEFTAKSRLRCIFGSCQFSNFFF